MGNDPVNGTHPSGSISLFDFASCTNTQWATQFTTMAIGSAIGYSTAKNNGLTENDLALATIGGGITGFTAGHYGYKLGASINYSAIGNSISNFAVNISNGINDIFKGAQNGNTSGWQDLSKSVLMTLAKQYSGKTFTSSGQWEDYVGDTFEKTFHVWAEASKNMVGYLNSYAQNTLPDHLDDGEGLYWPIHSSRKNIIIDAKATTTLQNVSSGKTTRFPEAAWFEIKAKQGNITPSTSRGQVAYEMQALVKDKPRAVYEGAAEFNIVTTTNSQVSTKIYVGGYVMGLFVRRWTPQYKIVNKKVKVRFGYEQGTRVGGIPFNITTIFWDDPGVDYQF
ncbi:hypothetical protein [[Flexibacter] sp. ATCC 35208]|uniref:hypothetical protein n=1 Tax=[Flexibacter] sp. ATCC 35208 TaxID=1936242 RepID=UPI0009C63588|nr:hypothetical protein [[Flexibacter] sp. ATCC 35208]OMP74635.1 hypothetical protein BW716_34295 [[Flexibacter] sp. ATCC 35208]